MHVHIIALAVIVILAGLAFYANTRLMPAGPVKNVIAVLIVVVAVLAILVSLGVIASTWFTVSP